MQNSKYVQVVLDLPLPSKEQIRQFAEYVSEAHSWYKHLPVHPYSCFNFFIDPNAGRQLVRRLLSGDQARYVDVTDDSNRFHYSINTTKGYREKFGYWNYYAPYGTSFLVSSQEGRLDTSSSNRPAIVDATRGFVPIPEKLLKAGSANVNSLVHPNRSLISYWAVHPRDTSARLSYPELFEHTFDNVPEDLRRAILSYDGLKTRKNSLIEGLCKVYNASFWEIINNEVKLSREEWSQIEVLNKQEEEILGTGVNPLIDQVREDQLRGMEHAMEEFLQVAFRKDF